MKKDKRKMNEEIAIYFGFRKSKGKEFLVNGAPQWTFPNGFPLHQCSSPNTTIPDFIQILEDYLNLVEKHDGVAGYPRQWGIFK